MWELHDRLEQNVNEFTCRAEIESFEKHGQFVAVLGRRTRSDPDHDVELIFGARRLFVARHLNKSLLVELREMSDRDCIIAMDIENRQRLDISPYERGLAYAHWLRLGNFQSQDDIAKSLKVSASQVSRLLKIARLPSVIVAAFSSPLDIREDWGLELVDALEDPLRRRPTIMRARAIAASATRLSPAAVYGQLIAASVRGRKLKSRSHDEVVKDADGAPLFRIRQQSKTVALLLPMGKLSAPVLSEIRDGVSRALQKAGRPAADCVPGVAREHKPARQTVSVHLAASNGKTFLPDLPAK
jgi:ParB family chromosome partitioning protein